MSHPMNQEMSRRTFLCVVAGCAAGLSYLTKASGTLLVLGRRFGGAHRSWFPLAALLGFGAPIAEQSNCPH